ncbi:MAG: hypothetical protein Marn2KO_03950 [Marinobacter nauticus]
MDTTTIVLLLAAIVTVSLVIIVFSQMREKARIERVRKMTAQEDAYNKAYRLLTEIPGQYLTPDLKLLLLKRMEDACQELIALKSDQPVKQWLENIAQTKKQILEKNDQRPPVKVDSPEKSTYIKELLQALFKLIEAMHKAGRIDSATAKKNLKYVLFLVHKTHADLHVFQARDFIRQNQIRKAIHAYHLASTEMGKSRDNPLAMKAVKSFRTRIKELEEMSTEGKMNEESHSKLDKEWDNFLQDDGTWKKKADYDD